MKHLLRINLQNLPILGDILKQLDESGKLVQGAELGVGLSETIDENKIEINTYARDSSGNVTGDPEQITIRRQKG